MEQKVNGLGNVANDLGDILKMLYNNYSAEQACGFRSWIRPRFCRFVAGFSVVVFLLFFGSGSIELKYRIRILAKLHHCMNLLPWYGTDFE